MHKKINKFYTRRNNRLKDYDYTSNGYYFITVCVENHQQIFGTIGNNQMQLNDAGNMINTILNQIPENYAGIDLDEHIVMPNHIHGIMNIAVGARSPRPGSPRPDNNKIIGRGNRAPTIGNIIAYFKYQTTNQINESQNTPGKKIWQRNYHDRIIRNDESLNNIRDYIINNPKTWEKDENNINIPVGTGL